MSLMMMHHVGSGISFDADYQAILYEANLQGFTKPSLPQQVLQNQLVLDLKTAGIWSKLDLFYNNVNDAGWDFCSINWINPSFKKTQGGFVWNSNTGIEKAATTPSDTNWSPTNDGINFTRNNACFFWKKSTGILGSGDDAFDFKNSGSELIITRSGTNNILRLNSTSNISFSSGVYGSMDANDRFLIVNRISSSVVQVYFDGILTFTKTANNSSVLGVENLFLGDGAYTAITLIEGVGGSLTSDESEDFNNIIDDYLTNV